MNPLPIRWGHEVPLDDFLISENGAVTIERYDLIAPDHTITQIPLPVIKKEKKVSSSTGMTIVPGDLGLRKIGLTDKTMPGTYTVVAETKATFFSGYLDKKGKQHMATLPMDEIKGAESFVFSTRYKATAKSYMGVKEWTTPNPVGHDLEIMPETDLSNVRAGDMVRFKVTLKGKPLTSDMDGINYLHMTSNTFGGPDKYMLTSYVSEGDAQIRVPTAGAWVASVMVKKDVSPDNELKALVEKCKSVYYGATVSFKVKP